jgi:hypothetical protein
MLQVRKRGIRQPEKELVKETDITNSISCLASRKKGD